MTTVPGLPDGCTPLETITIVKALDEDGNVILCHHATDGLNTWEAFGMVTFTGDVLRRALTEE